MRDEDDDQDQRHIPEFPPSIEKEGHPEQEDVAQPDSRGQVAPDQDQRKEEVEKGRTTKEHPATETDEERASRFRWSCKTKRLRNRLDRWTGAPFEIPHELGGSQAKKGKTGDQFTRFAQKGFEQP
jgi:hypothetical protein